MQTLGPKSFITSRPYVFVYESIHEEGGQPGRVGLVLPPNGGSWELNSGHQAWWQGALWAAGTGMLRWEALPLT